MGDLPLTMVSLSVGEHLAMTLRGAHALSKSSCLILPSSSSTLALKSLPSRIDPKPKTMNQNQSRHQNCISR